MVQSDESLREVINGGRAAPPVPQRLPRFEESRDVRAKRLRAAGYGAAALLAAVGVAVTAYSTVVSGPETAIAPAPQVSVLPAERSETAAILDGAAVPRHTPLGLNGRVIPESTEPRRVAARDPSPLRGPRLEAASGDPMAPGAAEPSRDVAGLSTGPATVVPGEGGAAAAPSNAVVVAASNLVWSKIFREHGLPFVPVTLSDLALWERGACADRVIPTEAAYCSLDQSIYIDPDATQTWVGVLNIAHEMGHHVQDVLGVAIAPVLGEERDRQADCLAGLWAQREPQAADALAPGALSRRLAAAGALAAPIAAATKARLEAFTQGYVARGPNDCTEIVFPAAEPATAER